MEELRGVHGTTASRAQSIRQNGIIVREPGRYGKGAYFWRQGHFADSLAEGWWKFRSSKNAYRQDSNPHFAIVRVTLIVEDYEHFDLEQWDVKEALVGFAADMGFDMNDVKQLAGLYDLFVEKAERELKVKFKVLELRVAPPPNDFGESYPIRALGPPFCYVAREAKCIRIDKEG